MTDRLDKLRFLDGGSEMGERIRSFAWETTLLGPIEFWPQSLKTSTSLMLNSHHPIWIGWGPDVIFLYNDAYIDVLSLAKHPQALGKPTAEVWAEIWDTCGPLVAKVFGKGESSFMNDVRLFMSRGDFLEETFYSFSYSPIRDESGNVGGLFCPSTEVTSKVLNGRRLRALSELAAESLAEKSIRGTCASAASILAKASTDLPFALIYLTDSKSNTAVLQEAIGIDFGAEFISPQAVDLRSSQSGHTLWPISKVVNSSQAQIVSIKKTAGFPHGPANRAVSEAIVLPLISRGQEYPLGVLVAGVNPTRQIDSEYQSFFELVARHLATAIQSARVTEEEKKRADMLAELDRAKTAFFSNVSHELRTPLTLILGPLEDGIKESVSPPKWLELAHRNSLRLLKLVNTLLDFTRIESGRVEVVFELTDLPSYTAELVGVFRSGIERAGLRLVVNCPALPQLVFVDREMWEKIVFNLLSNALKFTAQGEIEVKMWVDPGAQVIYLSVRDTGIGIPAEELPRVFERFHRIKTGWARSHEGTGIGLALVDELVRLHSGTVGVESAMAQGTTFTVAIPVGSAHLPKERIRKSRRAETTGSRDSYFVTETQRWMPEGPLANEHLPILKNMDGSPAQRIILADDNTDMREYVQRLLVAEGYEVIAVRDGEAALASARTQTPALVLSDIMMPRLDGFGLLHELRKDPTTNSIPIILLSARAGEESRVEGIEAGADDYLTKPFSARELLARVATHLKLARIRKEAHDLVLEREAQLKIAHLELQNVNAQLADRATHLEAVVQQRTAKLTETIGDLEAFSYSIAHDMRAPLRSLTGFSNILLKDYKEKLDEEGRGFLVRIANSAIRMDRLIQDVLNYSRVVRNESPLEKINLRQLLDGIIETYPTLGPDAADVQIIGSIPELLGNEAMLMQVFSNLLGNAVKFVPPGVHPQVRIWTEIKEAHVRIFVQDNGIGIPLDQQQKIFDIFQQVNNKIEGTGIGLAIVKKAVERMHGTTGVQSEPGKGSTFWLELKRFHSPDFAEAFKSATRS